MSHNQRPQSTLSRRDFLRLASVSVGVLTIAACAPVAQPAGSSDGAMADITYLSQGGDEAANSR